MEKKTRTFREWAVFVVGVLMALFDIITLIFHSIPAIYFRSTYLFFTLVLIFLLFPASKKNGKYLKKMNIVNWILLIASILTTVYAFFNMERIELASGLKMSGLDQICAAICIVVVLIACRRTTGNALPIIAIVFLLYAKFGQHLPGMLGHTGYSNRRILTNPIHLSNSCLISEMNCVRKNETPENTVISGVWRPWRDSNARPFA